VEVDSLLDVVVPLGAAIRQLLASKMVLLVRRDARPLSVVSRSQGNERIGLH
jgi:hypothetical protein